MKQDTVSKQLADDAKSTISNDGHSNDSSKKESDSKKEKESKSESEHKESYLEKFFGDMLKDIYWAEQHLVKSLPKMIDAATTDELKEAFEDHLHQTQKHVTRLEKVFSILGKKAEAKKCDAMEGLVKECESIIKETKEGTMTRDAALIIAAQKVEHYEIASYGGLVQLAITMGLNKVADILEKTLQEEENADLMLTDIAEEHINIDADSEGTDSKGKPMLSETMSSSSF